MASQQLYRLAVADAASRYYAEYPDAEVSQPSDTLNGEGSMSFDLPIEDPNIGAVQVVTREAVLFRDGLSAPFWRGPIVRPSASTTSPGKVGFQAQTPLWYFKHRFFGSPVFPTNYLINGSFELWSAGLPVVWSNSDAAHMTVTQVTTQANPGLVVLGHSAAELTCSTLNADTFLGQDVTVYPANSEGIDFTLSGWFYIVPTMTAGPFGGRGLFMQFVDGSSVKQAGAQFTLDPSFPSGLWLPASVSLEMPAAGTTAMPQWAIDVRAYCGVGGSLIWDGLMLTGPESLSPAMPGGSDQSLVLANIVRMAQGQAATGGVGFPLDPTKSNLHIGTVTPATGVLRTDLVYQYADRRGVLDALNDAPMWAPENDFAVVDADPTHRNFTTFGRAVTDGVTTAGSNTFSSATGAFTTADCYQPLWHQNIPAGALIVPPITSGTSVTFSGAGASASGSSLKVFIGGRRGSYRPATPLFMDATGTNLASVKPWDQDGDQIANSVVETTASSSNTGFVGAALKGVVLGTLTSTVTSGAAYTTIAVTALTVAVAAGDMLRVGVTQWQPGVGSEGEIVIASAAAAIGATSISIVGYQGRTTWGSTWTSGQPVTDFTAPVTMENVNSSILPAPIGQLTGLAFAEMQALSGQAEILSVTTLPGFIDDWCGGVPLICGDVLPTTVQWGYLNIIFQPYRITSWTMDTVTDAYSLQLNAVAL
ncbi:MAG: hypothetical protein V4472_25520 [Pseudomonadota bacterium]